MDKILIFKTDRIGDLINISPIFKNLKENFPNCEITLVCSKYNSIIAKYYPELNNILVYNGPVLFFLLKNFKKFFYNKYDLILQFDGKNHSYLSSLFIKAKKKVALKFIKKKKFLFVNLINKRPNFIISNFFYILEKCNEDYNHPNNKSFHYLSLYLKILEQLNFKISNKRHYLPYSPLKNIFFNNYILIHIDERWSKFDPFFYNIFKDKVSMILKKHNIVVTSNLNGNDYFNSLKKKLSSNKNIYFKNDASVNELINIIYHSNTVISSHTGFIVHVAASFNKKIIDVVSPKIYNELDRWIPFNIDYVRLNINDFFNFKF